MKRIVLLNVYGVKNIGDEAIYSSALKLINESLKGKGEVQTICADLSQHTHYDNVSVKVDNYLSPYGITLLSESKTSAISKIITFCQIFFSSIFIALLGKINDTFIPKEGNYSYIYALKNANSILNMGGGYLRTKDPIKDYFGLLLTVLPIFIAKLYRKPILFLPMSFGNFASGIHEEIAFKAIQNSMFMARDDISLSILKKKMGKGYSATKIFYTPDLALFLNWLPFNSYSFEKKEEYVVLTARKWLNKAKQESYENALAKFVDYIWVKYQLKTFFIAMASNSIEDNDLEVAESLKKLIINKKALVIKDVHSPKEVQSLLKKANLAICTRMHSAILSATVYTSFIAIAYEHKTVGFMESLGLDKWVIDINNFSYSELETKFDKLIKPQENKKFLETLGQKNSDLLKYYSKALITIKSFLS